jgi:hypothetical protein
LTPPTIEILALARRNRTSIYPNYISKDPCSNLEGVSQLPRNPLRSGTSWDLYYEGVFYDREGRLDYLRPLEYLNVEAFDLAFMQFGEEGLVHIGDLGCNF